MNKLNQIQTKSRYHSNLKGIGSLALCLMFIACSAVLAYGQVTVKLYPSVLRVQKGKTKTITAVAYDAQGRPVYDAAFSYFIATNSAIAGTSPALFTGDNITIPTTPPPNLRTISGISFGTTDITATWNGVTSSPATIIVDDPQNPPTAIVRGDNEEFGGTFIYTKVGEAIELNAEESRGVEKLEWNWGDGDKTTDLLSATHTYLAPGVYAVTLRITNILGQTATSAVTVHVAPQSQPTQIINVNTIPELLIAYNNATGGEHIVIPAGTVLSGEIELPAKNFTDYVTIRSSAVMPGIKTRVSPNQSGLVTIRTNYYNSIPLTIKNGATKIRLVGLKFEPKYLPDVNGPSTYYLAQIGEAFSQSNVSQNPTKIILEHCVINPPDDVNVVHGILNDGYKVSIISSWLGNIKTFGGQDSQAVVSFDGKGAHVYNNTFFEAASENVMYGGVVPNIDGLTTTNIEFRRCYFSKRLSWRTLGGVDSYLVNIKNLFETKNARRVYFESSVLENHWDGYRSQTFALVFKSATSPGTQGEFVPWAISEDIVFQNNKVRHIYGGISTTIDNYWLGSSFKGLKPSNIVMRNTLFEDLSHRWGLPGAENGARFLQPSNVEDLRIDHVTVIDKDQSAGTGIMFGSNNNFRLKVTNSIFGLNGYGIIGSGSGIGFRALNPGTGGVAGTCSADPSATWTLTRNVMPIYGVSTNCYPSDSSYRNSFPADYAGVGFTDLANGDYSLSSSSAYRNTAEDGSDPGVDMLLLNRRTACSVSGITAPCTGGTIAAEASILGRAVTAQGRGISKARITVVGGDLNVPVSALTSSFGYYRIDGLQAGETYVVTVGGTKRYRFETRTRIVNLGEDALDVDFVGTPN